VENPLFGPPSFWGQAGGRQLVTSKVQLKTSKRAMCQQPATATFTPPPRFRRPCEPPPPIYPPLASLNPVLACAKIKIYEACKKQQRHQKQQQQSLDKGVKEMVVRWLGG